MAFVSLTAGSRQQAEVFVKTFSLPWPCGYGATLPFLGRIGAYSVGRMSVNYNPGYEVSPTLYVIGPDGRVLWNDGQARPLHTKESKALVRDIDAAIERALDNVSFQRGSNSYLDVGRKAAPAVPMK